MRVNDGWDTSRHIDAGVVGLLVATIGAFVYVSVCTPLVKSNPTPAFDFCEDLADIVGSPCLLEHWYSFVLE